MLGTVFLVACLACSGHGLRIADDRHKQQDGLLDTRLNGQPIATATSLPLKAFALMLLAFKPAAGFTPSHTGLVFPTHVRGDQGTWSPAGIGVSTISRSGNRFRVPSAVYRDSSASILRGPAPRWNAVMQAVSQDSFSQECSTIDEGGDCVLEDLAQRVLEEQGEVAPKNVFGEMSALARELGSNGVDLGQGFPDFDPPQFVVQALRDELEDTTQGLVRVTHQYTRTAGYPPLAEALAVRYSRHLGRPIDPMTEVAVTVGCTNALFLSLQTVLDQAAPGCNEIVVLEPFFELYRAQTQSLKGTLRTVPLRFDSTTRAFSLDVEALRRAVGPKTAAIIINTPNNPTGKAFKENELLAIADIVREQPHVVAISDEVYKFMIFDPPARGEGQLIVEAGQSQPVGHVHFAALPGMDERTITVSSAGKTFGITGWQVGWAVGPKKWLTPMQRYMPNLQFCAPTLMQRALTKVLKLADEPFERFPTYYDWLRNDYSERRQRMVSALQTAGIPTAQAQSGFFLLADISDLCGTEGPLGDVWDEVAQPDEARDWTFCRAMAKKLGIVALPISPFFGPDTPDDVRTRFVRFCFAKTDSTLDEAGKRLRMLK